MVALAVLSLAAASCSPRRGSPIRSATGITSHTVCAAAFLQKVDPDEAYREAVSALPGFWSIRWALKYEIDPVHREVRSQVAGGFESRAVYRDGVGCLVVQRPEDAAPALAPDQIPADAPQGTDLGPLHPAGRFNGERTSHIYAEATSNTRHWARRDTTSSGTRIITDLSHDACSSRPLLRLSPVLAASV